MNYPKDGRYLWIWFGSALNYPKNGQHADFPGCVVYESKEYTPYIYIYIMCTHKLHTGYPLSTIITTIYYPVIHVIPYVICIGPHL